MAEETVRKTDKKQKVDFSIEAFDARQVVLAGDFNHWDATRHQMRKNGDGLWTKTLMLKPGQYEYKFIIDGVWLEDPKNYLNRMNCFGSNNSVLNL